MANITANYDSHTKDELLAEADLRGVNVSTTANKSDIVAALQLNDKQSAKSSAAPAPAPAPSGNIPAGNALPVGPAIDVDAPPPDSAYAGLYKKGDEMFALAVDKNQANGRTHFAKNTVHFWNGTEGEFRQYFEKQ